LERLLFCHIPHSTKHLAPIIFFVHLTAHSDKYSTVCDQPLVLICFDIANDDNSNSNDKYPHTHHDLLLAVKVKMIGEVKKR